MCGPFALSGGVSTHTKNLSKCLSELGVEIILFSLSGKDIESLESPPIRRIYQKTFGLTFEAIKKRKEYDIIHVQASGGIFSFISAITGCFASKICNKKLIITFHYSREEFYKRYAFLLNFVVKNSDIFIVVSKRNQKLLSKYIKKEYLPKIIVISNGYDVTLFKPTSKEDARKKLDIPRNSKVIVNIANLFEHKGHRYLIEAIKILKNSFKSKKIVCYIIGSGPSYGTLKKLINKYSLETNIKLVGWVPSEQLPLYINAADIFAFPSLLGGESFGIVQIEAMGCGTPVVAAKNGASEEIITSEDYGLLCEPANSKDLAEKILIALDKKWDHERILRYAERFRWENIAEDTINVYKEPKRMYV
jgi:glycosyltransferase involved in cell wall biosynthesis